MARADGLARRGLAGGDDAVGGLGDIGRFTNPGQLMSYVGLTGVGAHQRPQAASSRGFR